MPFLVAASNQLRGRPAITLSRLRREPPAGRPTAHRCPRRAGLAPALALALALTACGTQAKVPLPPKTAALAAPQAPASARLSPRQQVAAAYAGYWQAYGAAMSSQNAARARAILAPYDQSGAVSRTVKADQLVWAAHETAYGNAVTHILSVRVTGRRALLHDCLDLSHFGAQDTRTRRVVPDSFGLQRLNFYITLVLSGGRWLVTDMQPVVVPCEP